MTETIIPAELLDSGLSIEMVPLKALTPHPENYRKHPQEQLDHLALSLRTNGFYRPIVTARDLTILAGHGIAQAARMVGIDPVPVHRTGYEPDDPEAIKILVADNESSRLARNDDRGLADLLTRIRDESQHGLEGTGWDDDAFAALVEGIRSQPLPDADEREAAEQQYTSLIESPVYEPRGDRPAPASLVDTTRRDALVAEIIGTDMEPDVADFLQQAASRHLKFDYAQIAEFYAHADAEVQALMEASALVIIDADRAIELGFARLVDDLLDLAGEAEGEDEFDDIPE